MKMMFYVLPNFLSVLGFFKKPKKLGFSN